MTKKCPQCETVYEDPSSWFSKDKNRPSGLYPWCKPCVRNKTAIHYQKNRIRVLERTSGNTQFLKLDVLQAYGGPICVCCGESHIVFLCIDHVGGGGSQHRKAIGHKGKNFWRWLKNNGYPPGYRVLCHNCNMAIRWEKVCPHQTAVRLEA